MRTRAANPNQGELMFFEVPHVIRSDSGGLDIALAVRTSLTDTLGAAGMQGHDRHEVAARISRLAASKKHFPPKILLLFLAVRLRGKGR